MLVKIKTLTGKTEEIDVDAKWTVTRLKETVEEMTGVPPLQQRLIHSGKQMRDDQTMKGLDVKTGNVFHLVLALRGGY